MPNMRKILIVDDDTHMLVALMKRLSNAGFETVAATNGEDALNHVRENKVDAITLDVGLPGELDGLAVAAALRDDPRGSRIPIIFVTGSADEQFKEQCSASGGKFFIAKPYDADLLIRLLQSIFAEDELGEMREISTAKRRQLVQPRWAAARSK
ncbi:MAG: response regulator [Phycisphaerales bacterium]|nr:response regulator [Phycisphaerales bacterium]